MLAKLTTTSYVILGLLSLRDWSTYELAQQMARSIRYYWPRAESHIYAEPKKLVAHGLATATPAYAGRRGRTVYSITDTGRAALQEWLAEPGHAPQLEFEGLTKVLFAEQGSKAQLLTTIRSIRHEATQRRQAHIELASDLADSGGPFPDRLHINTIVLRFMLAHIDAVIGWATWAEEEVNTWPDDIRQPRKPERIRMILDALGPMTG